MTNPRRSTPIPEGRSRRKRTTSPPLRAKDVQDGTAERTDERSGDADLIQRLVIGDPAAWRLFVLKYQRLVLARVSRTLGQFGQQNDQALAEDICADVFALLVSNGCAQLRRFEGRSKLSTWLDVIARRVCLRKLSQSQLRSNHLVGPADLATVAGAAGDDSVLAEDRQELRSAMKQLARGDRVVLELFYFEERTYAQIASELELSINTVGPKLQRAQKRLRKLMTTDRKRTDTD